MGLLFIFAFAQTTQTADVVGVDSNMGVDHNTLFNTDVDIDALTREKKQDLLIEKDINSAIRIRRDMLIAHQVFGWATVGLLAANLYLTPRTVDEDVHTVLGIVGGSSYVLTALLGIFTPTLRDSYFYMGTEENPSKFFHKLMAFIHAPAMITTIVLGMMLDDMSGDAYYTTKEIHRLTSVLTVSTMVLSLTVVYVDF